MDMEPSINKQKIQAMKNYKRAKLVYNFALYSLTSMITCFFFSSPFWFPSITNHFFSSFPNIIPFFLNSKCLFVLGNLIVIILVGESKLKQSPSSSSSTSDIYDEYVARSRSSHQHKEIVKTLNVEEKIHHHEEKKEIKNSMPHGEEKKKGMRSCKSEVWGEGGILVKIEKTKGRKEEGEKIKVGMRSCKSAVWSESEKSKMKKAKGKKEEQFSKTSIDEEEKIIKMGMRISKSAVWSESERVKMEKGKGKKEEQSSMNIHEEKKMGMRSSRSAIWAESEIVEGQKGKGKKEEVMKHEEKKMGMRSCRSEIWSESEIAKLGKTHMAKEEEEQQLNVLNKRAEDFIARVNKQRFLEAKLVDHSRG